MKRLILFLAVAVSCMGQGLTLRSPLRDIAVAPAASALLIDENFEGTGAPSGWSSTAGTPDWDNTSAPIAGAQDLKMGDAATCDARTAFTDSSEVWVRFELFVELPASQYLFAYIFDSPGFVDYTALDIDPTGGLYVRDSGGVTGPTVDKISSSTKYWVFWHVLKGTGANAAYDVEFSTSATRTGSGNKYVAKTSGTLAITPGYLIFGRDNTAWGSGNTFQIDNVKVSNTGWPP